MQTKCNAICLKVKFLFAIDIFSYQFHFTKEMMTRRGILFPNPDKRREIFKVVTLYMKSKMISSFTSHCESINKKHGQHKRG